MQVLRIVKKCFAKLINFQLQFEKAVLEAKGKIRNNKMSF